MGKLIDHKTFEKLRTARQSAHDDAKKKIPEKTPRDKITLTQLLSEYKIKKSKKMSARGKITNIDSRRTSLENKKIHARINARTIKEEMEKNSRTAIFENSHQTTLKELPRSIRELKRFLGTLSKDEQAKIERLVEDITLDARVYDRSFTCTMVYLRLNKDPEIAALYRKIRAAIFANLNIMLPEIPDDIA